MTKKDRKDISRMVMAGAIESITGLPFSELSELEIESICKMMQVTAVKLRGDLPALYAIDDIVDYVKNRKL